eukprot:COSAG02_NODE_251_length_27002_cov_13.799242_24_plen_60_part_00
MRCLLHALRLCLMHASQARKDAWDADAWDACLVACVIRVSAREGRRRGTRDDGLPWFWP